MRNSGIKSLWHAFFVALLFFMALVGTASAEVAQSRQVPAAVSMPEGFRRIFTDASGKTWRETGEMPVSQDDAVKAVCAAMLGQGYRLRHDIGSGKQPGARLLLFTKEGQDEEVIVSLMSRDDAATIVSWGLSARTPPAPPESAALSAGKVPRNTTGKGKEDESGKKQ